MIVNKATFVSNHKNLTMKRLFILITFSCLLFLQGSFAQVDLQAPLQQLYTGGTVCYAFILLAMNVLRLVDVRIQSRQKTATVYFELRSKLSIGQLVRLAREKDCTLSELELYADSGYGDNLVCGTFTLWAEGRTSLDDILRELSAVEGVIYLTRI